MSTEQTITPLGERIVLATAPSEKPDTPPGEREEGGIILPADAKVGRMFKWNEAADLHHLTTVVSAGNHCKVVKPGDKILVAKSSVFYVNSCGVRFCACLEAGVVAIVG